MRLATGVLLLAAAAAWGQRAAPAGLAVEDRIDPIGVGDPAPEFSWLPADRVQTGYQIVVASSAEKLARGEGDRWDSGKVPGGATAFVTYAGSPLRSRETCHWKVRTWNERGEPGPWSAPGRFEMGLLANADWTAQWIWRDSNERDDYTYFRKAVSLPAGKIARARIYLSAAHRYELVINGTPVGKGPNFAYPEYQYYQTWAVEPFLRPGGENVFGLLCHWYGPGQGRPASSRGLIFQAAIEYADGASVAVSSDGSWRVRRGEWITTGPRYRNGEGVPAEAIDGRLHPVGWDRPGFDERDWAPAKELGRHPTPPWTGPLLAQETTITEYEIAPVSVRRLGPGSYQADFGKVWAGMPKIRFRGGRRGTAVTVTAAYRLDDDGMAEGFAQSTDLTYRYILRGGDETFRPYWYLGFRYLQVDNSPVALDAASLRMIVRHHRVDPGRSSFESSDATLNAIWELAKRSVMLGSQEQFVDTPTREQAQFTYDAYVTGMALLRLFGDKDLSQQGLREFAQSQVKFHGDTGKVNAVYPNGDGKRDIPDWTQSWIFWVWEYWLETGDRELVGDLFDNVVRAGEWVKSTENPQTGLVDLGNAPGYQSGIVDWPDRYGYDRSTTQRTVMSLNAWWDYVCVGRLAAVMGRREVQERFEKYAEAIRGAIDRRLWDDGRRAYIDGLHADGRRSAHASQQANAMAAALGVAQGDRLRGALEAAKRAGPSTAPLLAPFLVRAYGDHEEEEALRDYLLNPASGRNWAATLKDGGTFTYENWAGRRAASESSESHPFGAYGAVVALRDYVLGVRVVEPQAAKLEIRPRPLGLKWARGTLPTERGPLAVEWEAGTAFRLKVTLPPHTRADVYLPGETKPRPLGPGTHVVP
jgi:alpha-L-rhamnosidase